MTKRSLIALMVLTLGGFLVAGNARAADNVWLFDQTNSNIKPCFMFSEATGWTDFGSVGAQSQFAWSDFRTIVQSELGLPTVPAEATVHFTAIPNNGPCPAAGAKVDSKTVFDLNGTSNVYIFFGGHAVVRTLGQNHQDDNGDN